MSCTVHTHLSIYLSIYLDLLLPVTSPIDLLFPAATRVLADPVRNLRICDLIVIKFSLVPRAVYFSPVVGVRSIDREEEDKTSLSTSVPRLLDLLRLHFPTNYGLSTNFSSW